MTWDVPIRRRSMIECCRHAADARAGGRDRAASTSRRPWPRGNGTARHGAKGRDAYPAFDEGVTFMDIGIYGLGRMGGNMVTRLLRGGHRVVAGNRSPGPVDE